MSRIKDNNSIHDPKKVEIENSDGSKPKIKVLVVGAGFAGLSVAHHLNNLGRGGGDGNNDNNDNNRFDVTVVEAAERVGGRVWPCRFASTRIDLGGQWIHEAGPKNPIRKVMKDLGIPLFRYPNGFNKRSNYDAVTGKPLDKQKFRHARELFKQATNKFDDDDDDDDDMTITKDTSQQDLVNELLNSFKNGTDGDDNELMRQYIRFAQYYDEVYEGACLRELSVTLDEMYREFSGEDEMVKGGYGVLLDAIVDKIGVDKVRLNSIVKTIEYQCNDNNNDNDSSNHRGGGGGGVKLWLDNGETVEGDYCVCTVSLGVLQQRRITFQPDLPPRRWKAIDSMGMGTLNKAALHFVSCFWDNNNGNNSTIECFGAMHPSDPAQHKLFFDGQVEFGQPILITFFGGDASYRVDPIQHDKKYDDDDDDGNEGGMSDDDIVQECIETLEAIFPNKVTTLLGSKVTRWNSNPFTCGSYSFTKAGCTEEAYDEIQKPLGSLRFAGEATSKTNHATVHGAWMTGEREAKRLLRSPLSS